MVIRWGYDTPNVTRISSTYTGWWFGTFFHILGIILPIDIFFQRDWNHQPVYIYTYIYTPIISPCPLYHIDDIMVIQCRTPRRDIMGIQLDVYTYIYIYTYGDGLKSMITIFRGTSIHSPDILGYQTGGTKWCFFYQSVDPKWSMDFPWMYRRFPQKSMVKRWKENKKKNEDPWIFQGRHPGQQLSHLRLRIAPKLQLVAWSH